MVRPLEVLFREKVILAGVEAERDPWVKSEVLQDILNLMIRKRDLYQ